jgi:hypothetical protein
MNIEEERQGCTDSIVYGLTKTSEFRARKAKEYPQDLRNARAVETLKQLAKNAAELSADFWEMLRHHYNPDSKEWQDAVSQATKDVGLPAVPATAWPAALLGGGGFIQG